jgi:hypothetical protein
LNSASDSIQQINSSFNHNHFNTATPYEYQQVVDTKLLLQQQSQLYYNNNNNDQTSSDANKIYFEPLTPVDPWNIGFENNNLTFELFEEQLLSPPNQLLHSPTGSDHNLHSPTGSHHNLHSPNSSGYNSSACLSDISPSYEETINFDLNPLVFENQEKNHSLDIDQLDDYDFSSITNSHLTNAIFGIDRQSAATRNSLFDHSSLRFSTPPIMDGDESFGDAILKSDVFISSDSSGILNMDIDQKSSSILPENTIIDDQNSVTSVSSSISDFKGFENEGTVERKTIASTSPNLILESRQPTNNLMGRGFRVQNIEHNYTLSYEKNSNSIDNTFGKINNSTKKSIINNKQTTVTSVTDIQNKQRIINHNNSKRNKLSIDTTTRKKVPTIKMRLASRTSDNDGDDEEEDLRPTVGMPVASVSTPELTKDILDLEEAKFDLISYITASVVSFFVFFFFLTQNLNQMLTCFLISAG